MDKRIPLASYLATEATTHLANLTKSIQFFPIAHAATNATATMRKDTPVNINHPPFACSGKYAINVTKTTSNNVDNILLYRIKYQLNPTTTILAKMQFDANAVVGNGCDVEKIADKAVISTIVNGSVKKIQALVSKKISPISETKSMALKILTVLTPYRTASWNDIKDISSNA